MFIGITDLAFILVSTITFCLYQIIIKKFPKEYTLAAIFWMQTFAYGLYITGYFIFKFGFQRDVQAIEELAHEYTFFNAPLYLLFGINYLGYILTYTYLIRNFPLSMVIPFAQISILFTYLGVVALGDPTNMYEFIGIVTVTLGSLLTTCHSFSWRNPLSLVTSIPAPLAYGILLEIIFKSANSIILFFISQSTAVTEQIRSGLLYVFPFHTYDIFYTNLGTRFFMFFVLYQYIQHHKKERVHVFPLLQNHWVLLLVLSVTYLISGFAYQISYFLTKDKAILTALTKLNIPILLLFTKFIFKESFTRQKIVGSVVVVCGIIIACLSSP